MKVVYRGFEIEARKEKSLGGDVNIYFTIVRVFDGWFLEDAFSTGADRLPTFVKYLKRQVDDYLARVDRHGLPPFVSEYDG